MIKCWGKRTEAILPVFFRFRQVSFYIEIFEIFYTKRLQVRKIYLSLHSRLRKTSNTAEHGAVVQLVRMRACHARGRGFEPHPHRLKALHESEGLFRIWHLPKKRPAPSNGIHQALGIEPYYDRGSRAAGVVRELLGRLSPLIQYLLSSIQVTKNQ